MRLIVNHRDFPFFRDIRMARVVDVVLLVLLGALAVHAVRDPTSSPGSTVTASATDGAISRQVILTIQGDGRWTLDGQLVPATDLEAELRRVFAERIVPVLFVVPAAERPWGEAAALAARARATGLTVGLLPAR